MRVVWTAVVSALALAACTTEPPPAASARSESVVYGVDDRVEVYQEENAALRTWTERSSVALFESGDLRFLDDGTISIQGETLDEAYNLCETERYRDQPSQSSCSAALIDDDLVLTAGHCVTSLPECQGYRFVFGYHYAADGVLGTITRDDVYGCRALLATTYSDEVDYAVIQLDRPVNAARSPSVVRTERSALAEGTPLTLVGYPSGIPAKIAGGAFVLDSRASVLDYFKASVDAFGGNSGSPVIDDSLAVVGILVRGDTDYIRNRGCNVVNVVPQSGSSFGGEEVTYVGRALSAICDDGWPSERLCGVAAECGDARCTGAETHENCAEDCEAPSCGNGVCEYAEDIACAADCPRPMIPETWTCSGSAYGNRISCDCNCGAPDPDCATGRAFYTEGCSRGETCSTEGVCIDVPSGWRCNAADYGSGAVCNCGCGAYDIDCDNPELNVRGCGTNGMCTPAGTCAATSSDAGVEPDASTRRDGGASRDASFEGGLVTEGPETPEAGGFRPIQGCAVGGSASDEAGSFAGWLALLGVVWSLRRKR